MPRRTLPHGRATRRTSSQGSRGFARGTAREDASSRGLDHICGRGGRGGARGPCAPARRAAVGEPHREPEDVADDLLDPRAEGAEGAVVPEHHADVERGDTARAPSRAARAPRASSSTAPARTRGGTRGSPAPRGRRGRDRRSGRRALIRRRRRRIQCRRRAREEPRRGGPGVDPAEDVELVQRGVTGEDLAHARRAERREVRLVVPEILDGHVACPRGRRAAPPASSAPNRKRRTGTGVPRLCARAGSR